MGEPKTGIVEVVSCFKGVFRHPYVYVLLLVKKKTQTETMRERGKRENRREDNYRKREI